MTVRLNDCAASGMIEAKGALEREADPSSARQVPIRVSPIVSKQLRTEVCKRA